MGSLAPLPPLGPLGSLGPLGALGALGPLGFLGALGPLGFLGVLVSWASGFRVDVMRRHSEGTAMPSIVCMRVQVFR